jgi:hsp70-interacting protein
MMHLASSEDTEVREVALGGLLELARDETKGANGLGEDEKLKQLLQEQINGISLMSPEDLGTAREERQLVDSLWNTCYNEPPLCKRGCFLFFQGKMHPHLILPASNLNLLSELGL